MFNRTALQSIASLGRYPVIPAGWPNRSVRRAIQQGRESRLPAEWRQALVANAGLRLAVKGL